MIKKSSLILILCLAVNLFAAADTGTQPGNTEAGTKKNGAISITMFIPGLHQLETGRYLKGSLLLGSFAGCIAGTVIHNNRGNKWYEKYLDSADVEEIILFRRSTEKSLKKRNLFIAGILSTWVLHIIDLQFFKSKKGGVKGEVGKNSFNVGIYYIF